MGQRASKVKPGRKATQRVVCPHCSRQLDPRTAVKVKRVSTRSFLKGAMLIALQAGPASPREIESRMGLRPQGFETASLLRIQERRGMVELAGKGRSDSVRKIPTLVWKLTDKGAARVSELNALQPQAIDRARPNHKDSKRGARS